MIVFGAGGMAKDLLMSFRPVDYTFFDDMNDITELCGRPVINRYADLPDKFYFIIGIADHRREVFEKLSFIGGTMIQLISPMARIGKSEISEAVIEANTIVSTDATIERGVHLNKGVIVTHDCSVGEFSVLSPGVILGGGTEIGAEVFMGIGAITLPRVKIGEGVVVGAGAVVTKDIKNGTYVGVPAKKIN